MTIKEKLLDVFNGKEGMMFRSHEIKDAVISRFPDTNKTSILPADYCYNKTNKGNLLVFPLPLFEYQQDGMYKYLGQNFEYSGDVFWKREKIGEWNKGNYTQTRDIYDEEC